MLHPLIYVPLGVLFGFIAGLLGTSGGVIAVPVLAVAFGLRQQAAQGTALVMMLPNVAMSAFRYIRHGDVDKKMGIALVLGAIPCSFAAALIATKMHAATLRTAFAIFVFALAAFMAWRTFTKAGERTLHAPWPYAVLVGVAGGTLAGFFSGGAAALSVALLSYIFGLEQVAAQGMALILELPATTASLFAYGFARDIEWSTGIALAAGGVFGAHFGAELAHRVPEKLLRTFFVLYTIAAGILLLAHRTAK